MTELSAGEPGFQVVVFGTPEGPDDVSDALEEVLALHATDARIRVRNLPGVLPDVLPREVADRLADAIAATGLQAAVVPAADVPALDKAEVVHHAWCAAEGFKLLNLYGEIESVIPWTRVSLISVGQVPQERTRHFLTSDMAAVRSARRTDPSAVETTLSPGPEAWIICERPFVALRIDHKRMNYECLESLKTDSATENFRLFLDQLLANTPQVYLTPATRAWLEHGPVEDYAFESPAALARYTVLHVLIHRRTASGG